MNWTYAELFGGIGAPGKGFKRACDRHGDTCELKYYFEFDKYASNAYCAIHDEDESKNYWDITQQPELLTYVDIIFYSPPCQTFSIAGKKEGTTVDKGNLFYQALEVIKKSKPKYAIMENVANLKNQFKDDYNAMVWALDDAGYVSDGGLLNSKDYGIPQNRNRIFVVSIRKDLYEQGQRFEFPKKIKLTKCLADIVEKEVDEKYFLSDKMIEFFTMNTMNTMKQQAAGNGFKFEPKTEKDIAKALTTRAGARMDDNFLKVKQLEGNLYPNSGNPEAGRVYDSRGLSPAIKTPSGGNSQPKILVKSATKNGYETATIGDSINLEHPNSETRRGRVGKSVAQTLTTSCNQGVVLPCIAASRGRDKSNPSDRTIGNDNLEQRLEINKQGTSNTLTSVQKDNYLIDTDYRIRKLTPLECFRLQGFDDEDYYKAVKAYDKKWKAGASDSQMYKRAGNSITVNVEEELIENLVYQRKQEVQISMF